MTEGEAAEYGVRGYRALEYGLEEYEMEEYKMEEYDVPKSGIGEYIPWVAPVSS